VELVILAAGHGRRFGGLKQLAPVGPNGEAIMDYTARAAEACGFSGVVLVIREEIRREVTDHVKKLWSPSLPVEFVCQPPVPGTAQAVLCTEAAVSGTFGVANADDLYGEAALRLLANHLGGSPTPSAGAAAAHSDRHVLVAYQLFRTVLTKATVTRGVCHVTDDHLLDRVAEHRVTLRADGSFDAVALAKAAVEAEVAPVEHIRLSGNEPVSMNLWGFHPRLFAELRDAVDNFDADHAARPELLLPDVVGALVSSGSDSVHVVETANRCIGITHREDMALVRAEVAVEHEHLESLNIAEG